jgi:hypothetical protein
MSEREQFEGYDVRTLANILRAGSYVEGHTERRQQIYGERNSFETVFDPIVHTLTLAEQEAIRQLITEGLPAYREELEREARQREQEAREAEQRVVDNEDFLQRNGL